MSDDLISRKMVLEKLKVFSDKKMETSISCLVLKRLLR